MGAKRKGQGRAAKGVPGRSRALRLLKLALLTVVFSGGAFATLNLWLVLTLPPVEHLSREAPPRSAYMDRQARRSGELVHQWTEIEHISPHLIAAVVLSEDSLFFWHGGIDYDELWASVKANVRAGRIVRGAGTITLQTARNVFLSADKSFLRKYKETLLGLKMEHHLSKARILELYLNYAQWGPNLFGAGAAARYYFGKRVADLSAAEAAALAATLPAPNAHRPDDDTDTWVTRRRDRLLMLMERRDDVGREARRYGAKPDAS